MKAVLVFEFNSEIDNFEMLFKETLTLAREKFGDNPGYKQAFAAIDGDAERVMAVFNKDA